MSPAPADLVRLDDEAVAALRAWADIDRFQLPDVPLDNNDGWSAIGDLTIDTGPIGWPPRPEKSPERPRKVLDTRVMFGCLEVARLERLLDGLFSDDERFRQTGIRSPTGSTATAGGQALTCRGSFRVDQDGALVADSFSYSPLIDFARYVEHDCNRTADRQHVVSSALTWIDQREAEFTEAWNQLARSGITGYPAVERVLLRVRVHGDRTRYVTQWIWPDDQPAGQPPASFRADLLAAADAPTSSLLRDFMAGRPGDRPPDFDDVEFREALEPLLEPGLIPRAAWPSGYRLRLSQHIALTAILDPAADRLSAVNGPPGTGKTTVLRDLYANLVTRRAAAMCTFPMPSSAFGPQQELPSMNNQHWRIYPPDEQLCGFEMLVAAATTSAVEDITDELPASSKLSDGPAKIPQLLQSLGRPPQPGEWAQAGQRFRIAQAAVDREISTLLWIRQAKTDLRTAERDTLRLQTDLGAADRELADATARAGESRDRAARCSADAEAARARRQEANLRRPAWWARWRNTAKAVEWHREFEALGADLARFTEEHSTWQAMSDEDRQAQQSAHVRLTETRQATEGAVLRVEAIRSQLRSRARGAEVDPINEEWWRRRGDDRARADIERACAWISPRLQQLREELFLAAIDVHEVFARSCDEMLRANLLTWLALRSNKIQPAAIHEATSAAWRSFFLLIPLASATFESMAEMMRHVPLSSLGWLIIDEAGRAAPRAAVGGLARFQRAVVVGDPLQLEPLVTLPEALVDAVMTRHRAPHELAPTRASVQTLADAVSRRGTHRGRWVSLPLLVQHRCLDPMFSIANTMAYLDKMVQGRQEQQTDGRSMPIPAGWIDVPRTEQERDHFLMRDWQQVQRLLARFDWPAAPSVAVISPFKRVARRLMALTPSQVRSLLPEDRRTDEDVARAMDSVQVGTIHTGREGAHDVVILVLGGGTLRARQWAAGTPHLLNVAITRATNRLYVIGDRIAWQDVGFARYLDALPAIDLAVTRVSRPSP